jgi:hypothetical protein
MMAPLLSVMIAPVWLLMSLCTAKHESTSFDGLSIVGAHFCYVVFVAWR